MIEPYHFKSIAKQSHAKLVDTAVNQAMQTITGCLKPTNKLYPLAGIAPPTVQRQVAAEVERGKQESDKLILGILYLDTSPS